jgi:hypothetical protein
LKATPICFSIAHLQGQFGLQLHRLITSRLPQEQDGVQDILPMIIGPNTSDDEVQKK